MTTNRPLRVFLCHSSNDKPAVRELYQKLRAEAEDWIDPWLDKMKILPGQNWRIVIEEAVEASDIVIICLSNHSVNKEGFVQREIRYAYDLALEKPDGVIFLIPLRLEECEVPRGMRSLQWVDYFGVEKDEQYSNLLEAMKLRHKQKLSLEKPPAQPAGRVSNPIETVTPKQSQAEKLIREGTLSTLKEIAVTLNANPDQRFKVRSYINGATPDSDKLKWDLIQLAKSFPRQVVAACPNDEAKLKVQIYDALVYGVLTYEKESYFLLGDNDMIEIHTPESDMDKVDSLIKFFMSEKAKYALFAKALKKALQIN